MFSVQVAWSTFTWLGGRSWRLHLHPPSTRLDYSIGALHNQSKEAWTWNKYLRVTFFTGYFFYRWLGRYQVQVLRGGTECLLDLRRWHNQFKSHRYNKDWLEFIAISRMSQSMIKCKKISWILHYIWINWKTVWINSPNQNDLKYLSQEMTLSLNLSCGHVKAAVLLGRCLFWHLLWNPLFHKVGFGYIRPNRSIVNWFLFCLQGNLQKVMLKRFTHFSGVVQAIWGFPTSPSGKGLIWFWW